MNASVHRTRAIDPDISVIIVSWNARRFLEECLESLRTAGERVLETIVVDNASSDGSPEMVAARFPEVTLLRTGANVGFSRANNIGIRRSTGRYVALINSDVHVLPGCLDELGAFLDRRANVGMVGPRVMFGDGRLQSSCRHFPTLWNNTCEVLGLNRLFADSSFFSGEQMFHFRYDVTREVDVLVGCFVLARRKAIEAFGLLDEQFFMYGEDVDWCRRCHAAGWQVMFYPRAEAIHHCGGSSSNDPIRFEVAQQHARLQLWRKHEGIVAALLLRLLMTAQCVARVLVGLVRSLSSPQAGRKHFRIQRACLAGLWRMSKVRPVDSPTEIGTTNVSALARSGAGK